MPIILPKLPQDNICKGVDYYDDDDDYNDDNKDHNDDYDALPVSDLLLASTSPCSGKDDDENIN